MSINIICAISAYVLEVLDLIWFFIRGKKNGFVDRKEFSISSIIKICLIYICVVTIPVLCFFIDFGIAGNVAICACSVLGMEIANKGFLYQEITEEDSE